MNKPVIDLTDLKGRVENFFSREKNFATADTRHLAADQQLKNDVHQRPKERIDQKTIRAAQKKAAPAVHKINEKVTGITNKTRKLLTGAKASELFTKIANNKWAKRGLWITGSAFVFGMVGKAMTGFHPEPAIPKHYDRGYDTIKENLTDFGSPVNLQKTAAKVIMPYCSTVRKATRTSVQTVIDRNLALFTNKNAIRHTRY